MRIAGTGDFGTTTPDRGDKASRRRATVLVVALTLVLLAAAAVLYSAVGRQLGSPVRLISLPWPVLALLYAAAEFRPVEVKLRRQTYLFSYSSFVATGGLFCVSNGEYVLAATLGTAVALAVARRQRGIKLAFNIANTLLVHTVIIAVFSVFNIVARPGPATWLAAIGGVMIAYAISAVCIAVVVSLSTGHLHLRQVVNVTAVTHLSALALGNLGLVTATLLFGYPVAVWLIVVPTLLISIAVNFYNRQRGEHERLELLYETSQTLQSHPEAEPALRQFVGQAREAFQGGLAELTLFGEDPTQPLLRMAITGDGDADDALRPIEATAAEHRFRAVIERDEAVLTRVTDDDPWGLHDFLRERGLREIIAAPLHGENRILGAILVADHLVAVSQFGDSDLRLVQTLARQTSASLRNAQADLALAQLRQLGDELRHQTYHDALTGLANRASFAEELEAAATSSHQPPLAVLHLDIDDFKNINETLGPSAADTILVAVAGRIESSCRRGDIVARLGGDEFAVLMRNATSHGDVVAFAERLLETVAEPLLHGDRSFRLRCSMGVALASDGATSDELLRNADLAMYRSKQAGKHRLSVYESGMWEELTERLSLLDELADAVLRKEFRVFYQPIVDLASGGVTGVEALVRWEHPERGLLSPAAFVDAASESDLIVDIDRQVLDTACRDVAAWQRELGRPISLNVNVSVRQLRNPGLIAEVREALDRWRLAPEDLTLELTEQQLVEDVEGARGQLHALRELGVRIAIDDFGTGYSSLSYLQRFPVDILKIPRPFIAAIDQADHRVLARAIVQMGQALGLHVVAEGIETLPQRDMLRRWGCHAGQGFVFSKPVPADRAVRMLADRQPAASTSAIPRSSASTR